MSDLFRGMLFLFLLVGLIGVGPSTGHAQGYWNQLADGDLRYEAGDVQLGVDHWIGTRRAQSFLPEADNLSVGGTNHGVITARNNLFYVANSNHNGTRAHIFGFRTVDPGDDNWVEGMRLTERGRVGIGTHVPGWTLEARGKIAADGGGGDHLLLSPNDGTLRYWDDDWSNYEDRIFEWGWTDELGDHMRYFVPGIDNDGAPTFTHSQGKGFLFEGGAVGIGTRSPNEKLSVNGNVLAEEVIVDPGRLPDYVFEESYDLPTLKEVSSFIDEEGHLPSVPAAEEVEENGLRLGQMDATLLRKVEELTLYAIEQKKRADAQKETIDRLRRRLRHQRSRSRQQKERLKRLAQANDSLRSRVAEQQATNRVQQRQIDALHRKLSRFLQSRSSSDSK